MLATCTSSSGAGAKPAQMIAMRHAGRRQFLRRLPDQFASMRHDENALAFPKRALGDRSEQDRLARSGRTLRDRRPMAGCIAALQGGELIFLVSAENEFAEAGAALAVQSWRAYPPPDRGNQRPVGLVLIASRGFEHASADSTPIAQTRGFMGNLASHAGWNCRSGQRAHDVQ